MEASTTIATTLVTRRQAQLRLGGVSDVCMWRWERDERLAFPAPVKIGNRVYYREHELEAFIERQTMRGLAGKPAETPHSEVA